MDLQLIHKKDADRHTWTEGRNTRKESFSYDSVCGHASDVYPFIEKKKNRSPGIRAERFFWVELE